MPPQEQAELWMQLRDRMKVDWNEMTLQEKKAGTSQSYVMKQDDRRHDRQHNTLTVAPAASSLLLKRR